MNVATSVKFRYITGDYNPCFLETATTLCDWKTFITDDIIYLKI